VLTSCSWLADFRMVLQHIFNLLLMVVLFLNPLFSVYVVLTNESKRLRILAFLLLFFTALPFLFLGAGHFGSRALDS
jgi:K+ transporter